MYQVSVSPETVGGNSATRDAPNTGSRVVDRRHGTGSEGSRKMTRCRGSTARMCVVMLGVSPAWVMVRLSACSVLPR